jgi:hypothetical protein
MAFVVFWIVLGVLGVAVSWSGHLDRAEVEKTIRLAIERGALTDAAQIAGLREPVGLSWVQRLSVLGVMSLFISGGTVAVALVLGSRAPEPPTPLFAVAAFVACLGLGLFAGAWWLHVSRRRP